MEPIQVVLDTNVLVAALRSADGASNALLQRLGEPGWEVNISVALGLEYESVLKRAGLISGYALSAVDELLEALFARANLSGSVNRLRPSLRDPDDELILELAVASGAIIVTHNGRDFAGARTFGIRVLTPSEFLRELGAAYEH